jgi:tRNA-dihydrouridine synthase 1
MLHAKLFSTCSKYRAQFWSTLKPRDDPEDVGSSGGLIGRQSATRIHDDILFHDRPLIVQFCANDVNYLVEAALLVQEDCDAIDLNLGCPQDIARRGHYGSYLMDEWPLIERLLSELVKSCKVPITAKIRVFPDVDKTLDYVRMLRATGISMLTVHGRFREQKGHKTGLADWSIIREIKKANPDFPIIANGNLLYPEDIQACLHYTQCDGVMSAEGNLYNPAIFYNALSNEEKSVRNIVAHPKIIDVVRDYMSVLNTLENQYAIPPDFGMIRGHLFKLYKPCLNLPDFLIYREKLGTFRTMSELQQLVSSIHALLTRDESSCTQENGVIQNSEKKQKLDVKEDCHSNANSDNTLVCMMNAPKEIPHWRCQPYIRPPFIPHFIKP